METILNNGMTYRFTLGFSGINTYCFYDGKWNRISKTFKNWEEVSEWMNEMNKPVEKSIEVYDIPSNYYNNYNRYFGD